MTLVPPDLRWRDTFLAGARALQAEGLPWWADLSLAEQDFPAYVQSKRDEVHAPHPKTQRWAIRDGHFVGRIGILHQLPAALARNGGHIGYDTVPAYRGQGVATKMLREALPLARTLDLREVRLTCDDDNLPSIRVIERNGGQLLERWSPDPARPMKRVYRIPLPPIPSDALP